jgi:hypothetical protein
MIEFTCCDCGNDVLDISLDQPPDPPRCCVCLWIEEWLPPEERPAVRERLRVAFPIPSLTK